MTNQQILDSIKTKIDNIEQTKRNALADLFPEFSKIFKELFEKSELINSIGWTAYTPYFNDGEECVFRINTYCLYVNGVAEEDVDFLQQTLYEKITEDNIQLHKEFNASELGNKMYIDSPVGKYGNFPNEKFNKKEFDILKEFTKLIENIPTELHKDLFGDHVEITVFRDGTIKTKEYKHE